MPERDNIPTKDETPYKPPEGLSGQYKIPTELSKEITFERELRGIDEFQSYR
ncbi:hypothetical protein [Bacillus taeanensis]|uniref:hypothetical protein n=1 Tax=Bacillus taeanensis TaxID=273032 RepID=UPI0015EFDF53|nr:hypothetical protein [Bacillus taeanensis]